MTSRRARRRDVGFGGCAGDVSRSAARTSAGNTRLIFAALRLSPRYQNAPDDYLLNKAAGIYTTVCRADSRELRADAVGRLLALLDARSDKVIDAIEFDDFQYVSFALSRG
jgi:hypothetical protein